MDAIDDLGDAAEALETSLGGAVAVARVFDEELRAM